MEENQNNQNIKFDFRTLITIIKGNWFLFILILAIAFFAAFFFNRYSQPLYESLSIIQIKSENKATKIFNISNKEEYETPNTNFTLELIRSKEFIKSIVASLNLQIAYYAKGKILDSEIWNNCFFKVEAKINNPNIYNKKISCKFLPTNECIITIGGQQETKIPLNKEISLEDFKISINLLNSVNEEIYENNYYFIIYDENTIVKKIINNLNVSPQNGVFDVIRITYLDNDPKKVADIVNVIANKFIYFEVEKKEERTEKKLQFIDEQLEYVGIELANKESEIMDYKIKNGIISTDENLILTKNNSFISQTANIESEIMKLDYEISVLTEVSKIMKDSKNLKIYEILALLSGQQSSNLFIGLINSIQELYNKREILLFDVTENSNRIKIIDEQIESRKKTMKEFLNSTIEHLTANKTHLEETAKNFERKTIINQPVDGIEISKLNREYSIIQNYYSQLINAKIEILISKSGFYTDNQILEAGSVNIIPNYPNKQKVFGTAFAIALLLIIVIIALKYLFFNKILTVEDIANYTKIPILGGIPKLERKLIKATNIITDYPRSRIAEAFSKIRLKLKFYDIGKESRVICVSSTISGEGKTFFAINLAVSYALLSQKVIIVDLDLRKPSIHNVFNSKNDKGISTILINQNSLQECINNSEITNLDYVNSGTIPPNPAELLQSEKLAEIIKELRQRYDIIIFDTSPIGIVSDALNLFTYADNSIYVFRSNVSRKNNITFLENNIINNEIKHLSIILNDIKRSEDTTYQSNLHYYSDDNKNSYFYDKLKKIIHK
ncbi:MAG: polysaccharide biosynthesis tyrosine autokinase [Bacteroidales bacterium]|jgi:capsular exopolysaccharide synthesis family protein|nr:polysaccharide biosynthesis tyrosine autokinase [Bacteroidales bacterium]